jgi:hypothetical protein
MSPKSGRIKKPATSNSESPVSREFVRAREFWDRSFREVAPDVRDAPPGRDLSDIIGRLGKFRGHNKGFWMSRALDTPGAA